MKIRVGSRASRLAVAQAQIAIESIKKYDPEVEIELITVKTSGDLLPNIGFSGNGDKGMFVRELDMALIDGRIDIAVHSLKDIPMCVDERIPIVAYSKRGDPRDVIVFPRGSGALDPNKPIGSASLRRKIQLERLYKNCNVLPVRGNIQTRFSRLDDGEFSALVLAVAGLDRLGVTDRNYRVLETDEMIPAAGQGIIAIQARSNFDCSCLAHFDDKNSRDATLAERTFIRALDGECSSPIAAYASICDENLTLIGMYVNDYGEPVKGMLSGHRFDAEAIAQKLAYNLKHLRGKVYLVGAGPGDPELLTMRGLNILKQAQVVLYDRLVSEAILQFTPHDCEKISVGKVVGGGLNKQADINDLIVRYAKQGKRVVRLKGGDPFLFGRGAEELEILGDIAEFEVCPGVSASTSVPSYAGIPLTHRGLSSSVHIIAAHSKNNEPLDIDFASIVHHKGTLVFMMGVETLPEIASGLLTNGMDGSTPCCVIENGTLPMQRKFVGTIANISEIAAKNCLTSPACIIVGAVCSLHEKFDWFSRAPLLGKRILITRPAEKGGGLQERLSALGALVTDKPYVKMSPLDFNIDLDLCTWLVFTSSFGIKCFFRKLYSLGLDSRALGARKVAVVGTETARELGKYGIIPDFIPQHSSGAVLAEQLISQGKIACGDNICLYRASGGHPDILSVFQANHINYTDVHTYMSDYIPQPPVNRDDFDYIIFTSGSCVRSFVASNSPAMPSFKAVCIGKSTAKFAYEHKMDVLISEKTTIESIIERITDDCKK